MSNPATVRRPSVLGIALAALIASGTAYFVMPPAVAACGSNAVVCENANPGAPRSEWDVTGSGDPTIQGFATAMSVNRGETVRFKVKTDASSYQLVVYRMGYYDGFGARHITTLNPSAALPQAQPACLTVPATGLVDCGNWAESASWPVPADATSGIYFARLTRTDTGGASHVVFIVRDDAGHSDLVFQASDTTWQAYNRYGGNSLYTGGPGTNPARAYKVSYNRPLTTRGTNPDSAPFNAEYPMVRWLEANGYDVSYISGIDTDRSGATILTPASHKAFLSVGRDEFWSAAQRANVEAARNAGMNLAFFSGKALFWKSRWEASIDGTNTPFRTLVSYRETNANAAIDPAGPGVWTGTWRDPRFSPPADGGRPENALSGTISTVECCSTNPTITVPATAATLSFWRNTPIAASNGGVLSPRVSGLAVANGGLLASAWDEDLDNGARPKGLLPLSATSRSVTAKLQDLGSTYASGFATHTMTMYRHASGALVFGAGTMQWSWGLDNTHDRLPDATSDYTNLSVQQATVNLLADMRAQPLTLQAGLTAAAASVDRTPPASTIALPSAGATVIYNAGTVISGTAADAGGKVALVEVSVDGGQTWKRANGRESWSYNWGVVSTGPLLVKVRATDEHGNVETPGPGVAVNAVAVTCPCTLWNPALTVPAVVDDGDANAVELGVKFRTDASGFLYGLRFYKSAANTGTHIGRVYSSAGVLLTTATFTNETPTGWQQVIFPSPINVAANTTYIASYHTATGHYSASPGYFTTTGVDATPLHAPSNLTTLNGVYAYGAGFPTHSYNATNYWVDVIFGFALGEGSVPVPPVVTAVSPSAAATGVGLHASARVTFSQAIAPATISTATIELRDAANAAVTGAVFYDAATRTATFDPAGPLAPSSTYTLVVKGGTSGPHVNDSVGRALTANFTSSFTTIGGTTVCPCTIWPPSAVPGTVDSGDPDGVELGVRFRADGDGFISAVRFYKSAANTGTHLANLWTAGGTLLATATFANESASGWQEAAFTPPVAIVANVQYVASYHTNAGHYSVDEGGFSAAVDAPPLHADAAGANGVYRYGATGFPSSSYAASNYWVDVVYITGPDTEAPQVLTTAPAGGATTVSATAPVTATFDEALDPATVTTGTFELRDTGNTLMTAAVSYDAPSKTATLTPAAPLAPNATYTARLRGGSTGPRIKDVAGNALASDAVWSFITAAPIVCPCTIWPGTTVPAMVDSGDGNPVEVGVKFRADIDGLISGLRFYKSAANGGTHIGHLWTAGGTLLATAVFTAESASGWQQVTFPTPVPITANTQYVASYYTSAGHYSVDRNYFATTGADRPPLHALSNTAGGGDGVYRYGPSGFPYQSFNASNYWVDVVFTTGAGPDLTPPSVVTTTPPAGASGVSATTLVRAAFSEAINAATVTASTVELRTAGNALVTATVSYDASSGIATLTPSAPLTAEATYTARVHGGAIDPTVRDVAGNALGADVSWSFTVAPLPTAFVDTSVADFSRGTLDSGGALGAATGGDLSLAPWVNADFDGTTLPPGWTMSPWTGTASAPVALGAVSVDGALVATASQYHAPLTSLEFTATFSGAPYQHAGFALTFNEGLWAIFSSGGGDGLYARSNGGGARDTFIPGNWFGAPHRYRIDWRTSSIVYSIDGVQVASHAVAIGASMRPVASDYAGDGSALRIDSMRMTPYAAASTFVSGVFDAASTVTWTTAGWTGTTPPGTGVTLSVRYGSTPVPDATWTAFSTITGPIDGVGRYLQYRLQLVTTDLAVTPVVHDVTVNLRR